MPQQRHLLLLPLLTPPTPGKASPWLPQVCLCYPWLSCAVLFLEGWCPKLAQYCRWTLAMLNSAGRLLHVCCKWLFILNNPQECLGLFWSAIIFPIHYSFINSKEPSDPFLKMLFFGSFFLVLNSWLFLLNVEFCTCPYWMVSYSHISLIVQDPFKFSSDLPKCL